MSATELVSTGVKLPRIKEVRCVDGKRRVVSVHVTNRGSALAWGNADEIDMAADSVMRLAEETMTADDFREFLERNNLTQEAAALLLGRSPRQLKYYLSAGILPRIVSLACI